MSGILGPFMETESGAAIYLKAPDPGAIHIGDIAASLSRQCRFGGHLRAGVQFYSVAEHCVLMARYVFAETGDADLSFAVLMHDAHEAIVQDIIAPTKRCLPAYAPLETGHAEAVHQRFGIAWPPDPRVRDYDLRMLAAEREQVKVPTGADWGLGGCPPLPITIAAWMPGMAREAFMAEFRRFQDLRDQGAGR